MYSVDQTKRESVSALLDGELSAVDMQRRIDDLLNDRQMRSCWLDFHTSRDALQSTLTANFNNTDFLNRFSAALEQEPIYIAPAAAASRPVRWAVQTWRTYGLTGGAIAAAMAFFTWMALPAFMAAGPGTSATLPTVTRNVGQPMQVPEAYVLAHQQFSPVQRWQGGTPYVRSAVWSPQAPVMSNAAEVVTAR